MKEIKAYLFATIIATFCAIPCAFVAVKYLEMVDSLMR